MIDLEAGRLYRVAALDLSAHKRRVCIHGRFTGRYDRRKRPLFSIEKYEYGCPVDVVERGLDPRRLGMTAAVQADADIRLIEEGQREVQVVGCGTDDQEG